MALSPSEFNACIRALISAPVSQVPAGIRQHNLWLGEAALHTSRTICRLLPDNIPHLDTRGYLHLQIPRIIEYSNDILLVFPPQNPLYPLRVIEYSDDILFVFPRQNLLYPPTPVPDTITISVAAVSVWAVVFM